MAKPRGSQSSFFKSNLCSGLLALAKACKPKNSQQLTIQLAVAGLLIPLGIYWHQSSKPTEVVVVSPPETAQPPGAEANAATPPSATEAETSTGSDYLIDPDSQFTCALQADREVGGELWTVAYEQDGKIRPWLRMVREMGNGWNTEARCQEIAARMNDYREAGLTDLLIRPDANTPGQMVICALTELAPQVCPPVLTLMPEDDADETLYKVLGPLQLGREAVLQCSDAAACPTTAQYRISVRHQLAGGE